MSEIMIERLKNSVGKHIKIFLKNGFRYEGKVTNCDDTYVEILEPGRGYKLLTINEISEIDVSNGNEGVGK